LRTITLTLGLPSRLHIPLHMPPIRAVPVGLADSRASRPENSLRLYSGVFHDDHSGAHSIPTAACERRSREPILEAKF
jgi:hypothetical protein